MFHLDILHSLPSEAASHLRQNCTKWKSFLLGISTVSFFSPFLFLCFSLSEWVEREMHLMKTLRRGNKINEKTVHRGHFFFIRDRTRCVARTWKKIKKKEKWKCGWLWDEEWERERREGEIKNDDYDEYSRITNDANDENDNKINYRVRIRIKYVTLDAYAKWSGDTTTWQMQIN